MRRLARLAFALLTAACATAAPFAAGQANTVVVFETGKGNIEIEVDAAHAPLTAANFLKYVDGGFYDEGTIVKAHRR
jgi:peptidyl-prolyl cis-trans isomerase A (cyclophilin A)